MCRVLALPPNFRRNDALDILEKMEGPNTDGVGMAYVKDRKFMIYKKPYRIFKP